MGTQRLGVKQAEEQAEASRGAELSGRAHTEIGLWLAATPPEGRNEQRLLAEVARTHGLAARQGDQGWDVEATKRAFRRMLEQGWWRQLDPKTLGAPELGKGFPLLQEALARQGQGEGPGPVPGHCASLVKGAQQARAIGEYDRRPTSAETDEKAAGARPTSEWGGWGEGAGAAGAGRRQQGGEGPLSAEEWQQTQIPMDSARNWLMAPARRDQYLRAKLSYLEQRPSHPEWAPFDPARPPGREAAKDPPRGQNWFTWELRGRPDWSPVPQPRQNAPVIPPEDLERAFPGFAFTPGPRPRDRNEHWWGTVDRKWRQDYLVGIPNRWGIRHPQRGVTKTILCNREVAPHLIAALDELDRRGLLYLVKTVDTFAPRYQQDWKTLSSHAFVVSLDMNQQDFPKLSAKQQAALRSAGQAIPQQDPRLIAIMQQNGFSYGGYWEGNSYDPMHFEFSDREALGLEGASGGPVPPPGDRSVPLPISQTPQAWPWVPSNPRPVQ